MLAWAMLCNSLDVVEVNCVRHILACATHRESLLGSLKVELGSGQKGLKLTQPLALKNFQRPVQH